MSENENSSTNKKSTPQSNLEKKYQFLSEHMAEAFALCEIICDEKNIPYDYMFLDVNKAHERQTGLKNNFIVGKSVLEFYPDVEKPWIKIYGEVALTKKSRTFVNYNHNTGKYYEVFAFPGDNGQFGMLFRDITEQKKFEQEKNDANAEKDKRAGELIIANKELALQNEELVKFRSKLEHIAHYDSLTNLPNRVLLADRLSQAMAQCHRRNRSLAVAFMDLDGFKAVNDNFGHKAGDDLLIAVARRMQSALREGDTLARIGGDEFIAVMVDLERFEDSEPLLKRLLKAAAKPIILGDAIVQVSTSIGITLYPQDCADADQLIRHADQAMYVAKQAGKNRFHLFDTAQNNAANTLQENIKYISVSLNRGTFILHYQPKVNIHSGELIGVEALIRWQHPERGMLTPVDFLPLIEGHLVSIELGEWVIDSALSQIRKWQVIGINLSISVNISAYQLQQKNFLTRLTEQLAVHPEVPPYSLELEILETTALQNVSEVSETMNACNDLGVRFALDDFGTGYSSLTYLKRLPAHMIKIDQSFVRDMLEDPDDLAIVKGIIGLAKAFQREVIAEGVETLAHGQALLQLGCQLAQGYGIARPMSADDIPEWISSWKTDISWQINRSGSTPK